jgi:4,5-DOPA dioxygenase extradiol
MIKMEIPTGAKVKMPALFIGHGSPMNAIEDNLFTRGWREMGAGIPRPRAILVISAHWETRGAQVLNLPKPEMIYDMYGFPRELYEVKYPAPGSPETAKEIVQKIKGVSPTGYWGFDHGAWSILVHLFPDASVPCFQLSLSTTRNIRWHYDFARQLSFLREEGILIVGSGNIVHNLRFGSAIYDPAPDWAIEFDKKVASLLEGRDHEPLINYKSMGSAAELSVNSAEHYLPMLYIASLHDEGEKLAFYNEGNYDTLINSWMRCFKIG